MKIINKQTSGEYSKILGLRRVFQQYRFNGDRVVQSIQNKAQVASNGYSLVKTCYTVLSTLGCFFRASQKTVIHVVTFLVKDVTTLFKKHLVVNGFQTRRTHQTYLVGVLVTVLLSACNEGTTDLDDYFAAQRAKPARPIKPIPELKPYLRYMYPKHEKDPFDVAMLIPDTAPKVVDSGVKLDANRVREFLEGFPLDALSMVGTVNKESTLWALIKTPDGGVQSIKKDNYLGQNYGRVLSISETEISIKEVVPNGNGGYKERESLITLKDD